MLINVKMPTIVGVLTWHFNIMSRKNFDLSRVEHERSFTTSGPGPMLKVGNPDTVHFRSLDAHCKFDDHS